MCAFQVFAGSLIVFTLMACEENQLMEGQQVARKHKQAGNRILSARALNQNKIEIEFENENFSFKVEDVAVEGPAQVKSISAEQRVVSIETTDLSYRHHYFVSIGQFGRCPVNLGVLFDPLASAKKLGFVVQGDQTTFRLFSPRATTVRLVMFEKHDDRKGAEFDMELATDGVWQATLPGTYWGKYYGYKVHGPSAAFEKFDSTRVIADPYSLAAVSKNSYQHESKSIIIDMDEYDWEGDTFIGTALEDLIIYEMHVRDMTVHPSSELKNKGTYLGLTERTGPGGLNHVLELGANAVELLPCQDFSNFEIPYGEDANGIKNTWNPYERNHWGYMTTYFFAPEPYYASGTTSTRGAYLGIHGQQVNEFRDMVKAFHREGIAVIMDVVYNHVSQYDYNPFKLTDSQYFFEVDGNLGHVDFATGCGNQLKTDRPMARRMIVESVKFWMEEYHIDGFRFDLAAAIDWQTIEEIAQTARRINPNVILIAEPWSLQGYAPAEFSDRGWAAWNDIFRNGIKGQNPHDGLGFIFGKYWNDQGRETIERFVRGSTRDFGGQFVSPAHSVNYLEAHDDLTLGDFIRIGSGEVDPAKKIKDVNKHVKLSQSQLRLNKLAALLLMTSQGPVMLHAGQEFARSKVIAETDAPDAGVGTIDHNSYNKDNETNWLDFGHKQLNLQLFQYYQGLIALRQEYAAFRRTNPSDLQFLNNTVKYSIGYFLPNKPPHDGEDIIVLVNANPTEQAKFVLPKGEWRKIADAEHVSAKPVGAVIKLSATVPAQSGVILVGRSQ